MSVDQVRSLMVETMGARQMAWDIPGPPHTGVERVQCWPVPDGDRVRLVLVEIYRGGGFDLFPQVLLPGARESLEVIRKMGDLESRARDPRHAGG